MVKVRISRVAGADRPTATSRDVRAGCFVCHGGDARWFGGNAQGVAARHHDATQHEVWCDVILSIRYGTAAADPRQSDIEDAIGAVSSAPGGGRMSPPVTDPDTPAAVTAGASAPIGRPVETARSRPKAGDV